jgi:hypothetical protein
MTRQRNLDEVGIGDNSPQFAADRQHRRTGSTTGAAVVTG